MPEIPIRAEIVSLFVIRETDAGWQTLLMKRAQSLVGAWCQVAGGLEEGEAAWQGALRELREETGLAPQKLYSADICERFYEVDADAIAIAPVFLAITDAKDEVRLNEEHSDYRWLSFDEARDLVEYGGQRRCLTWIEEKFIQRPPSRHLQIEIS